VAVVGLIADSIDDVPVVWTSLLRFDGEPSETRVALRAFPSSQVHREIRAVQIKTKHMSEKDQALASERWQLDFVCRAFVDSEEWDAPIFGAAVEKYRKFFPDIAPGLVRLDGAWTDDLKRQYFRDDPAVMQLVYQTHQKMTSEQVVAAVAESQKKDESSRSGSASV